MLIDTQFNLGDELIFVENRAVSLSTKCIACNGNGYIYNKKFKFYCTTCDGEGCQVSLKEIKPTIHSKVRVYSFNIHATDFRVPPSTQPMQDIIHITYSIAKVVPETGGNGAAYFNVQSNSLFHSIEEAKAEVSKRCKKIGLRRSEYINDV